MSDQVSASFLHPEQRSLEDVTQSLVHFLRSAREEVSVAIHDFHTDGPPAARAASRVRKNRPSTSTRSGSTCVP